MLKSLDNSLVFFHISNKHVKMYFFRQAEIISKYLVHIFQHHAENVDRKKNNLASTCPLPHKNMKLIWQICLPNFYYIITLDSLESDVSDEKEIEHFLFLLIFYNFEIFEFLYFKLGNSEWKSSKPIFIHTYPECKYNFS